MGEKVYKVMKGAGATSITMGVIVLVVGIVSAGGHFLRGDGPFWECPSEFL